MKSRIASPSRKKNDARGTKSSSPAPITLVSNRLPLTFQMGQRALEGQRSVGGLVSALEPVLEKRAGKWVGWAGAQLTREVQARLAENPYPLVAVDLSSSEVDRYYHGLSNRTLWPLFHCFPGLARFNQADWDVYAQVNEKFATAAVDVSSAETLIWVQDYHLMVTPMWIRRMRPEARLAFFLHIPFPPLDILRLLPWSRELLRGVLSCDLVGFHVATYTRNFLDCCEQLLGARVDRQTHVVHYAGRATRVGSFPIGIDYDYYEGLAKAAPTAEPRREKLVLGVDRLDYTKGISERLLAFERLLELHPEHREHVVFLQLAVPSRSQVAEYRDLKRQIDELVGRINGRFSTATWSPIRYLYQSVPPERLVSLYRDSHVALVTPGRDGMNLVAKEYVACQTGDPGVLVLSRLAGAAETMSEAVLVNPYDLERTAQSLHRALTMDERERRERMEALQSRERRLNVTWWVESFLAAAREADRALHRPDERDFARWFADPAGRRNLAVFVDADSVLHKGSNGLGRAVANVRAALDRLSRTADIDVGVVSARSLEELRAELGDLPATLVASLGLEVLRPGEGPVVHEDFVHHRERMRGLKRDLQAISGSVVRGTSVSLRFELRPDANGRGKSIAQARTLMTRAGFRTCDVTNGVEALVPSPLDPALAIMQVVRDLHGQGWSERVRVVYVSGDASQDETLRKFLGLGPVFQVGVADTPPTDVLPLPDLESLAAMFEWLSARRQRRETTAAGQMSVVRSAMVAAARE